MNDPLPPPTVPASGPAVIRTATPIGWGVATTVIAHRLGVNLTVDESVLVAGVASIVFHKAGMLLQLWKPRVGAILLGTTLQPVGYTKAP